MDELPPQIFRVFDEVRYASDFVQRGIIRLGRLDTYKKIEDETRRDSSEGKGGGQQPGEKLIVDMGRRKISSVPGMEELHVEGGAKSKYVLCFQAPENGMIQSVGKRFGAHVAVVADPAALIRRLEVHLREDDELSRQGFTLEHGRVLYSKGQQLPAGMTQEEKTRLGWLQKPIEFQYDQEYRICIQTPLELDDEYIFLDVGDLSDIARIAYRPKGIH